MEGTWRGGFRRPSPNGSILTPLLCRPPPPPPATPHAVSYLMARVSGGPWLHVDHQNPSISPPAPPPMACGRWRSFEGISMGSKPRGLYSLTNPLLFIDKFFILVCISGYTGVLQVEMAACKVLILFKAPREKHVAKLLRVIKEHMDMDKMVPYDAEDVQKLHRISGPKPSNCKMTTSPGVRKVADGSIGSSERSNILVHIPPELLVHLNVSSDVLRSSYLLPSVMR